MLCEAAARPRWLRECLVLDAASMSGKGPCVAFEVLPSGCHLERIEINSMA